MCWCFKTLDSTEEKGREGLPRGVEDDEQAGLFCVFLLLALDGC